MSFLSFDIGSSHCKGVVFSTAGYVLAEETQRLHPEMPRPGFAEMNPDKFWSAICTLSRALTAETSADPIEAVCLSSHGETIVPVDRKNQAVSPAILNMDSRAVAEVADLAASIGREKLFRITGQVVHFIYSLPKMIWLRRHAPAVFQSTHKFLSVPAYLLSKMNLPPCIDYSLASRCLAFDLDTCEWSAELLAAADLKPDQLPSPIPAGTVVGKLGDGAARELSLPAGTPVVLGGHDQACGALGVGVVAPGRVSDSMGTFECILIATDKPERSEEALRAGLNSAFHVVPKKFTTLAYFPAGIMIQWFHNLLFDGGPDSLGAREETEHFRALELLAPNCPTGLSVTPHLLGTCNPDFNSSARAAIAGLSAGIGRGELFKGILEGIACELARISRLMVRAVGQLGDFYAVGGGSRSRLGVDLRAALTNRRFHLMRCQEAVCLGGAILAATALGHYRSVEEAAEQMVAETSVVEPDPECTAQYANQVRYYEAVFEALEDVRRRFS
jgi:xylulokinase